MKKYHSIVRYGHKTTVNVLNEGDQIVIQEKLDGANASFKRVGDELLAFSRNHQLSEENNLGGFYDFVKGLDIDIGEGFIFFGEWLNPHKIKYPNHVKTFWLYDIYNEEGECYVSQDIVRDIASFLGLNYIPTFYKGEYKGYEHLQSFVGETALGGMLGDVETGEGIVVKNVDYKDKYGNQLFVKLVTDKFIEVQSQKAPKDPKEMSEEEVFVRNTLTEARVEKLLYKLADENIIEQPFQIEDMKTILDNIKPRLFDDIMDEEGDSLSRDFDVKMIHRGIGKTVAGIVKNIIQKQ